MQNGLLHGKGVLRGKKGLVVRLFIPPCFFSQEDPERDALYPVQLIISSTLGS